MFELGDKFGVASKFDWDNNENESSSDDSLNSFSKPVCLDPEIPGKGLYFIGSRTVTASFEEQIEKNGSNALRWLFAKGHQNYPNGFLNQPYDKSGRLNWLQNVRAKNVRSLFQNKVVAKMNLSVGDFSDGYYIVGIEDDSYSSDSVHFRFWYIDCSEKVKMPKRPGNGIDIQSTFPGGQNFENIFTRQLEGDVPIVDGTLPGWGTSPDGSVISYIKYGLDVFQRFFTTVSLIKSADEPVKRISVHYELDRSESEFSFPDGDHTWDAILDKETNSDDEPSKYNWNYYRGSIEEEEMDFGEANFRIRYNVTETWESEGGDTTVVPAPPTFLDGRCQSATAQVGYKTQTDDNGVHHTEFYQCTVTFKLIGLLGEELEYEEYRHGDGARQFLIGPQ
jgi:hypothetical protein